MRKTGNRKPTIKDVAMYSGVSTATVERALNNRGCIRQETKNRVLKAIAELGYSANDVAKALQNNRIYTILAVYHTVPEYFTEDFAKGFAAAEANLRNRGLVLKTIRTKSLDPQCAVEAIQQIDFSTIDAMVIDCGGPELDACIQEISASGIPVATFGSDSASSNRIFYVGEDPFVSGQVAGEIAGKIMRAEGALTVFQGPTSVDSLNLRTKGFLEVIEKAYPSIKILPPVNHDDDDILAVRGAIKMLTQCEDLRCIFCNSAGGTIALHRAIQYLDLSPSVLPEIIGYDFNNDINEMLQSDYCSVTIYQNPHQQAFNVLSYMFEYITKNIIPPRAMNFIPCDLVFKYNAHMFLKDFRS